MPGRSGSVYTDGEGDARKFLAVETAYIEGHIFKALVLPVEGRPKALSIKYSIKSGMACPRLVVQRLS